MRLTGLTAGTTYFFRVRSADGSGNAPTAPATSLSFKTYVAQAPAAVAIETGTLRARRVHARRAAAARAGRVAAVATSIDTIYQEDVHGLTVVELT